MAKKSNLWKYIAAAVGGVAVIVIVVVGTTGDYFQGRSFSIKAPEEISKLRTVAPDKSVEAPLPPPPSPTDARVADERMEPMEIPRLPERCYTECELTNRYNSLVTEVRNINFTATINDLEARIRTLENTLSNGNFTSSINQLKGEVNVLQNIVNIIRTQIGGFEYTSTINSLWSGIYSVGNALTNHTSAHNQGDYPPIYGVDY
jgi:hypothetical protein